MRSPLFRTKSGESKRRPVLRCSSRDEKSLSLLAMAATSFNDHQESFQASYESVLLQSSQDMDDIMRRFQAVIGIDGDGSHKIAPRASEAALSKLPRARILRPHKKQFEHDQSTCGVCCERLIDGVALVRLPCGHVYHIKCSTSWLSKTCTCPECRYEIETDDVMFEKTRVTRMKGRETVSCKCHPSGMHNCFFVDPSKSLFDQLDCCAEVTTSSADAEAVCKPVESDECSLDSTSTCDCADPKEEVDRYFY